MAFDWLIRKMDNRWTQVALVAAGGVNFALLLYLVWNARHTNRKQTNKLEQQLTQIKLSVSSSSSSSSRI